MQFGEHAFTAKLFPFAVEHDPLQVPSTGNFPRAHTAYEDIVFPGGETVPGIRRHTGYGDRGYPKYQRLLDTFAPRDLRNARTLVGAAVTGHGPAVVPAGQDNVDFIPSIRAVFVIPNLARN